jgi:hypothetical protein
MKGIFSIILLLVICNSISAQKTQKIDSKNSKKQKIENLSPQAKHDAYIQKANNQRVLGWFTLGLGSTLILGGTAKMMSDGFKDVSKTDIRLIWLPAAGIIASVGSFFIIKDSKNKRKKAALLLQQESTQIGHPQNIPNFYYPTVGVRLTID